MKEKTLLCFTTALIATVIIAINLLSIYYVFVLLEFFPELPNEFYLLMPGFLVYILNYYIVKNKHFLQYKFRKDTIGGIFVISIVVLTAFIFIIIANIYRAKMFGL